MVFSGAATWAALLCQFEALFIDDCRDGTGYLLQHLVMAVEVAGESLYPGCSLGFSVKDGFGILQM